MDKKDFDKGTDALAHLAEELEHEREAGASAFVVPEDDPDYVDDVDTIEQISAEQDHDDGPPVPMRPM